MLTQKQLEVINDIVHEYNKDITYTLDDVKFINGEWQSDYLNNYTDSMFCYYQQYLLVEKPYANDDIYIGVYVDTFGNNCDGDLIDTELETFCTINKDGEYIG